MHLYYRLDQGRFGNIQVFLPVQKMILINNNSKTKVDQKVTGSISIAGGLHHEDSLNPYHFHRGRG